MAAAPVAILGMPERAQGPPETLYVCVQEDKEYALSGVEILAMDLFTVAVLALVGFLIVVGLLWLFVFQAQGGFRWWRQVSYGQGSSFASPTPAHARSTAVAPGSEDQRQLFGQANLRSMGVAQQHARLAVTAEPAELCGSVHVPDAK